MKLCTGWPRALRCTFVATWFERGQAEHVGAVAGQPVVRAGESALHPDVRTVGVRDFDEHHLDEHLRLGPVEVGDDLADLQARFLVGDDDELAGFRVHGNRGGARWCRRCCTDACVALLFRFWFWPPAAKPPPPGNCARAGSVAIRHEPERQQELFPAIDECWLIINSS